MMIFWVATDADGSKYMYTSKPEKVGIEWASSDSGCIRLSINDDRYYRTTLNDIKNQTFEDEPIKLNIFDLDLKNLELV